MELRGWNGHMEWADILHVLWIGVARDITGTLLLEVAEYGRFESSSFDGRLRELHEQCVIWCTAHRIRPSTVEAWSVSAVSHRFLMVRTGLDGCWTDLQFLYQDL